MFPWTLKSTIQVLAQISFFATADPTFMILYSNITGHVLSHVISLLGTLMSSFAM